MQRLGNKKIVPAWLHNQILIRLLKSEVGLIVSYWIFQGVLYMDGREIAFKLALDIILTVIFVEAGIPLILAICFAHTVNMFLNGHFYVLKHNMGRIRNDPAKFLAYMKHLHERLMRIHFLVGAAAYGSLTRDNFKLNSDLDVRLFPQRGISTWIKAVSWIALERSRAFFNAFPLDIYAVDLAVIENKIRADEPPIIFSDPEGRLAAKYPDHILFEDFAKAFREKHVR